MNSLLLRRRCAGAPRVGVTKIYVTGGEYQWFSPETYRDLNHFYFTANDVVNGYLNKTPYEVSFTIGRVSGITTDNPSKVKLVYDKNSYTINNWCFDIVSDIEFSLTPKIVAGRQVWDIITSFTIKPAYGVDPDDGYDGDNGEKVCLLQLQQYPGVWDDEYCYFQIKPNSMYVMTTDDLVTDEVIFARTSMKEPSYNGICSSWVYDNIKYRYFKEDDTNYYFYTIPEQEITKDLPINTCIESIYLAYYSSNPSKLYFGGWNIYISTSIKQQNADYYTLSINVSSDTEAFGSDGFASPIFHLGINYYDPTPSA